MARKQKKTRDSSAIERGLKCYENCPNINMVIPWIYEIANNMSSRDSEDDEVLKGLRCYENQPNINMTIPWIYQIYKSVKSGGGSGGSGEDTYALYWEEE